VFDERPWKVRPLIGIQPPPSEIAEPQRHSVSPRAYVTTATLTDARHRRCPELSLRGWSVSRRLKAGRAAPRGWSVTRGAFWQPCGVTATWTDEADGYRDTWRGDGTGDGVRSSFLPPPPPPHVSPLRLLLLHLHTHALSYDTHKGHRWCWKVKGGGGSLTFQGCLEMLTRQQPLTEMWTNKGGTVYAVHSFNPQRNLLHTSHISSSSGDLMLDNGRLINMSLDRTVAGANIPYAHKQYFRVDEELPVQFVFFKRRPAAVLNFYMKGDYSQA